MTFLSDHINAAIFALRQADRELCLTGNLAKAQTAINAAWENVQDAIEINNRGIVK